MTISAPRTNRPFKFGARDRREFIVQDSETAFQAEYDASNNAIYLGRAKIGTLTSESKWQIMFLTYDASNNLLSIEWPQNGIGNASAEYEFVWDSRAGYTYS